VISSGDLSVFARSTTWTCPTWRAGNANKELFESGHRTQRPAKRSNTEHRTSGDPDKSSNTEHKTSEYRRYRTQRPDKVFDQVIRQKLLSYKCCLTFCRWSTVVIQLHWSSWTYQQHSTQLTMRFCFSVCELLLASTNQFTGGFSRISALSNRVCMARASQIINFPPDVWCASRVSVGLPVILFVHRHLMLSIEDNSFSPHLYVDDTQV